MAGRFVSPDQVMQAAKDQMLNGQEPKSHVDWVKVINFVAFNMDAILASSICRVMKTLYDIPLTDDEIEEIVEFQNERRPDDASLYGSCNQERYVSTNSTNADSTYANRICCKRLARC